MILFHIIIALNPLSRVTCPQTEHMWI